jgi:hypothetical protein
MAAPIRGAGAVVEVQGVAVGQGWGVGEVDAVGVTAVGDGDGLDDGSADGDGDGDGDSDAIGDCGVRELMPWTARARIPAARVAMAAGIAKRRCWTTHVFTV